jgi:hypothetical protein
MSRIHVVSDSDLAAFLYCFGQIRLGYHPEFQTHFQHSDTGDLFIGWLVIKQSHGFMPRRMGMLRDVSASSQALELHRVDRYGRIAGVYITITI